MPEPSFANLLVVCAIAVGAPLLLGFVPRVRVPSAVLEIVAGILVGPAVLGLGRCRRPAAGPGLSRDLAFLLFLAGLEIDLHQLRARLLRLAAGRLRSHRRRRPRGRRSTRRCRVGGVARARRDHALRNLARLGRPRAEGRRAGRRQGRPDDHRGRHRGRLRGDRPAHAVLLHLGRERGRHGLPAHRVRRLGRRAGVGALPRWALDAGLGAVLERLQDTTAQIRVRMAVAPARRAWSSSPSTSGWRSILGAFLAGAIVSLLDRDARSHPLFRVKLDAIGYGFLIPVFFVTSGVRLDLQA